MFYGVHSVITVVMSFIMWQGCQVIASGFPKMSRCQSVRKIKNRQKTSFQLCPFFLKYTWLPKISTLVPTQVYKTKEKSEQMQRSSVVQSGHNLLDKAGFWDQNQMANGFQPYKGIYKANKEKAAFNYPPLLSPTHWSPSYFSLPTNFTNKLPYRENIPENHLAYRNQSWEVESGSYSGSLRTQNLLFLMVRCDAVLDIRICLCMRE